MPASADQAPVIAVASGKVGAGVAAYELLATRMRALLGQPGPARGTGPG